MWWRLRNGLIPEHRSCAAKVCPTAQMSSFSPSTVNNEVRRIASNHEIGFEVASSFTFVGLTRQSIDAVGRSGVGQACARDQLVSRGEILDHRRRQAVHGPKVCSAMPAHVRTGTMMSECA